MANNFTAGGTTFKSTDNGGVHVVAQTLSDTAGADAMGLVIATPAANTVLGRLKAIVDALSGKATEAKQDAAIVATAKLGSGKRWFAINPADAALATVPDAIYVGGAGNIVARGSDNVDATFAVVAGQVLPISPVQVRAASTATGLIGLVS